MPPTRPTPPSPHDCDQAPATRTSAASAGTTRSDSLTPGVLVTGPAPNRTAPARATRRALTPVAVAAIRARRVTRPKATTMRGGTGPAVPTRPAAVAGPDNPGTPGPGR